VASVIKVDRIQSDTGTVNLASNLAFSSAFSMSGPVTLNSPTIATPTMTGQAVIPSINLTGGQIVFPVTQNPSSNANTMDDYEEGTWTPATAQMTLSSSIGYYTKIGNVVYFNGMITKGAVSTTTSIIEVTGLPFTVFGGSLTITTGSCWLDNGSPTAGDIIGALYINDTISTMFFLRPTDASQQTATRYIRDQDLNVSRQINFSGWYLVP